MGEKKILQPITLHMHPLVLAVTASRLIAALSLFYAPLWGFVAVTLLDWLDSYILIHRVGFTRKQYQQFDKVVDWASQVVMVVMGSMQGFAAVMITLSVYRLIGHLVFIKTGSTKYFVLFPNFIEVAFLWWVALPTLSWGRDVIMFLGQTNGLIVCFVVKEIHEMSVHFGTPWVLRNLRKYGYPAWMRHLGFHNLA